MTVPIPDSHRDLLDRPLHAVLTTLMPDGQPQSSLVWCDYDGTHIRISTALERQKCRNIQADPRVSLLVIEPADSGRYLEVRGEAHLVTEDAEALADALALAYTGKTRFYGDIYPEERRHHETRVILLIRPTKVNRDAVHR